MKGTSCWGVEGLNWSHGYCRHLGREWARWGQARPRAGSAGASQDLGCAEASLLGWACVWVWTAERLASSPPGAGLQAQVLGQAPWDTETLRLHPQPWDQGFPGRQEL